MEKSTGLIPSDNNKKNDGDESAIPRLGMIRVCGNLGVHCRHSWCDNQRSDLCFTIFSLSMLTARLIHGNQSGARSICNKQLVLLLLLGDSLYRLKLVGRECSKLLLADTPIYEFIKRGTCHVRVSMLAVVLGPRWPLRWQRWPERRFPR